MVRIVWAEDNSLDRQLILESLVGARVQPDIDFAEDGREAVERTRTGRPDLVVLDLKMPRVGGLDALRLLRDDPALRHLPVVVFSSSSQPSEVDACRKLGVVEFVQKPLDFEAFEKAVLHIAATASGARARVAA